MNRQTNPSKGYRYTPQAQKRRNRKRIILLLLLLVLIIGIIFFVARMNASSAAPAGDTYSTPIMQKSVPHFDYLDKVNGADAKSIEKEYEGFRLCFNPSNKTPEWVAWELLGTETDGQVTRSNKFHTDFDVEGCPDTKDYTGSGYDRGHMCPAADQKWSSQAMSDCFFMTNMAPQSHELNTGAWKTLEEKERVWAQRDSAIVIVAGPIYTSKRSKRIGEARVRVPDAFFKCILAPYANPPRAIAFVYDNARCPGNMADYVTTVDEVEAITGLDLFYALPDDIENEVEKQSDFKSWQ